MKNRLVDRKNSLQRLSPGGGKNRDITVLYNKDRELSALVLLNGVLTQMSLSECFS